MNGKFYGIYPGICVETKDPKKKSRIRLKVPQVLGTTVTNWADACLPVTSNSTHNDHEATITTSAGGDPSHTHSVTVDLSHSAHVKLPRIGQVVWVMFVGGDPNFPVWIGVGA